MTACIIMAACSYRRKGPIFDRQLFSHCIFPIYYAAKTLKPTENISRQHNGEIAYLAVYVAVKDQSKVSKSYLWKRPGNHYVKLRIQLVWKHTVSSASKSDFRGDGYFMHEIGRTLQEIKRPTPAKLCHGWNVPNILTAVGKQPLCITQH